MTSPQLPIKVPRDIYDRLVTPAIGEEVEIEKAVDAYLDATYAEMKVSCGSEYSFPFMIEPVPLQKTSSEFFILLDSMFNEENIIIGFMEFVGEIYNLYDRTKGVENPSLSSRSNLIDRIYDELSHSDSIKQICDDLPSDEQHLAAGLMDYMMDYIEDMIPAHFPYEHYLRERLPVAITLLPYDPEFNYECSQEGDPRIPFVDDVSFGVIDFDFSNGYNKEVCLPVTVDGITADDIANANCDSLSGANNSSNAGCEEPLSPVIVANIMLADIIAIVNANRSSQSDINLSDSIILPAGSMLQRTLSRHENIQQFLTEDSSLPIASIKRISLRQLD